MPRLQQHPSNPVLQGRTPPGGCLPCLVVGCVSRDRAACGRWPGRASPAPKNQPSSRLQINRCQTSGRWRTNADMTALTFLETEGRLRTRKPNRHAVVALPSLVAVQKSTPRSDQPGRVPENHRLPAAPMQLPLTKSPVRVIRSPFSDCSTMPLRGLCCAARWPVGCVVTG